MLPAGDAWQVSSLLVPRALAFYVLFSFTAVWWTAPVYAVLAELIPAHRRSAGLAIFQPGHHHGGRWLWPAAGGRAERFSGAAIWQRGAALGAGRQHRRHCFFLGMLAFAWTIKPYAAERLIPAALRRRIERSRAVSAAISTALPRRGYTWPC